MKAWRLAWPEVTFELSRTLQLGHAGEGVEIRDIAAGLESLMKLQLGHAGEGVEMGKPSAEKKHCRGFNWATPVKAWRWH